MDTSMDFIVIKCIAGYVMTIEKNNNKKKVIICLLETTSNKMQLNLFIEFADFLKCFKRIKLLETKEL